MMSLIEQIKKDLHDSIMRGELELGTESDTTFNYARIHRWIDSFEAAPDTKLVETQNEPPTLGLWP